MPQIMGIVNCTPDSFYAPSRPDDSGRALSHALAMVHEGADIIDIGGESTRPGARPVSAEQQIRRTIPLIKALRQRSTIPISIDTRSARVATAAIDAGANMINDISALSDDVAMRPLAAERGVKVVLMHMKGKPVNMQENPVYSDAVSEIRSALLKSAESAIKAGVREENIILDPGIGFGKRLVDNKRILAHPWQNEGFPVLIGLSRKSFLGQILQDANTPPPADRQTDHQDPSTRLFATIAAQAWCLKMGVDILRVHDVQAAKHLVTVWEALECPS